MVYVIWRDTPDPTDEGALLLGSGKVVFKHGTSLDAFKAAGARVVALNPEDYDAIPTIGSAFK